jgi:hypothetical protein
MQVEFQTHSIDLNLASRPAVGQEPINIEYISDDRLGPVSYITVHRYGRFGNNTYQIVNAFCAAKALRIPQVFLRSFDFVEETSFSNVQLKSAKSLPDKSKSGLVGSFYAPYGFESIFKIAKYNDDNFSQIVNMIRNTYRGIISKAIAKQSIVLHFRSGDVFNSAPHHWYVQPPASYYMKCFDHACENSVYDLVELVYEDRSNPAIEIVENELASRRIAFESRSTTVGGDLVRLLSADCIISSYGTFCEAAGILSKYLKNYYCFRDPSSQNDLRPFSQCWTAILLLVGGLNLYVCDDFNFDYIRPRFWQNSEEQQSAIRLFPESALRIYGYN